MRTILSLLAVALLASAGSARAAAQPRSATVQRVIDATRLSLEGGKEVRLLGVGLPTTTDPARAARVGRLRNEAAAFVRTLVDGKRVRLDIPADGPANGRSIFAYVYLDDGRLLNAEVIKSGWGFAAQEQRFALKAQFQQHQREAHKAGRGIWRKEALTSERPGPSTTGSAPRASDWRTSAAPRKTVRVPPGTVFLGATGQYYHRGDCPKMGNGAPAEGVDGEHLKALGFEPCPFCRPVPPPASAPATRTPAATAPQAQVDVVAKAEKQAEAFMADYERYGVKVLVGMHEGRWTKFWGLMPYQIRNPMLQGWRRVTSKEGEELLHFTGICDVLTTRGNWITKEFLLIFSAKDLTVTHFTAY